MVLWSSLFERYPRAWQPAGTNPALVSGGFSGSMIWKVDCPAGFAALKCWNLEMTADRVAAIHDLLAAIAAQGVNFLATPIPASAGQTCFQFDNRLWELSRWAPGEAIVGKKASAAQIRAAAEAVAHWRNGADRCLFLPKIEALGHARLADDFRHQRIVSSPAVERRRTELSRLRERLGRQARLLIQGADDHRASVAACKTLAAVGRSFDVEDQLQRDFRGPVTLALRDIHREHILFNGEDVTGLIDFGAVAVDSPAVDLARLLGSLAPDDRRLWEEGFAAYSRIAPLESHDLDHAWLLDRSGTLIAALRWLEWLLLERRSFANRESALMRWESLVSRLEHWG